MANKKSKSAHAAPATPSSAAKDKKDVAAAAAAAAAVTPASSPKMKATTLPDPDDEKQPSTNDDNDDEDDEDDEEEDKAVSASAAAPIKVNKASLTELKLAVDDLVKEFFSRPSHFTPSHIHEDVRLILGWSAVIVSAITGYYGYVVEFHQSKFGSTIGVIVYSILNTLYWLYVTYVEKQTIFQGKRRTFASRISTETISLSSTARSIPQEPYNFPFSHWTKTKTQTNPTAAADDYPLYTLHLSYIHTSNNGKSLIRSFEKTLTKSFREWVDSQGVVHKRLLENDLQALLSECLEG
ncbi:hypothetical protein MVLG_02503 [Microbotryum lychnidis-dioicae p1A1 Lamole]|uniref:Signal peptidase complex subunit 2 n=1 Tax=Microbotryum lychnidis-dioicae (strain p1A1 Lamole / MvSl-1064) TaxID=683840 RepID=U5H5C8_USTV1|nr:hypothetical protein MVLG_02503 [Microbotryum lychnidis-dioicae p1A1 Lamole]|eukprot:KDE07283.1 hypothetical protein MVLG_02503 [Microbotryum lychnidis-dioicae p1A1 Lamole]